MDEFFQQVTELKKFLEFVQLNLTKKKALIYKLSSVSIHSHKKTKDRQSIF